MCLKRLNYDRKELERRREASQHEIKGNMSFFHIKCLFFSGIFSFHFYEPKMLYALQLSLSNVSIQLEECHHYFFFITFLIKTQKRISSLYKIDIPFGEYS